MTCREAANKMLKLWLETKKQNPDVSDLSLIYQLTKAFAKAGINVDLPRTSDESLPSSSQVRPDTAGQTVDPKQTYPDSVSSTKTVLSIGDVDLSHKGPLVLEIENRGVVKSLLLATTLSSIKTLDPPEFILSKMSDLPSLDKLRTLDLRGNKITTTELETSDSSVENVTDEEEDLTNEEKTDLSQMDPSQQSKVPNLRQLVTGKY